MARSHGEKYKHKGQDKAVLRPNNLLHVQLPHTQYTNDSTHKFMHKHMHPTYHPCDLLSSYLNMYHFYMCFVYNKERQYHASDSDVMEKQKRTVLCCNVN